MVEVANPRAGEHVKDPACGSADFLISAFQFAERQNNANIRDSVWGSDHSAEAVQVAILNMVLNGDGKSQIKKEDSLAQASDYTSRFQVMLCNPPFGVRITEKRQDVLRQFDLGYKWTTDADGACQRTGTVATSQQVGLLFAELCVRQTAPGGRIGIILPNGYLGNHSPKYVSFREWLIRHTRVVAIVAFPRFTFKKSGADVSASAVFLEKRQNPLARAVESASHPFYAGLIESVGWSVSKRAERLFKRNHETGDYLIDENNERIPDADFNRVLSDVRGQNLLSTFPWLSAGSAHEAPSTYNIDFGEVLDRSDLSLDPKRWSQRYRKVRDAVQAVDHFALGEIVDVIEQEGLPDDRSDTFEYIEIQNVNDGMTTPKLLRGWQLPDRARHRASMGDIFVGAVWSSVSKWFIAGGDCSNTVVSNGFERLRLKPECGDYLVDIVAGLVSETYLVQARALCTGSDGLAELGPQDICEIMLPRVADPEARNSVQELINALLSSRTSFSNLVKLLQSEGRLFPAPVDTRGSHVVQV